MKRLCAVFLTLLLIVPFCASADEGYLYLRTRIAVLLGDAGVSITDSETPPGEITVYAVPADGQLVLMGDREGPEGTVWLHVPQAALVDALSALCGEWDAISARAEDGRIFRMILSLSDADPVTADDPETALRLLESIPLPAVEILSAE